MSRETNKPKFGSIIGEWKIKNAPTPIGARVKSSIYAGTRSTVRAALCPWRSSECCHILE